jgi:hypothetical protein
VYDGVIHNVGSTASEGTDFLSQLEAAAEHLGHEKTLFDAYELA